MRSARTQPADPEEFCPDRPDARALPHAQYDVHPDGERFLMIRALEGQGEIAIVRGWTEELSRLTGAAR